MFESPFHTASGDVKWSRLMIATGGGRREPAGIKKNITETVELSLDSARTVVAAMVDTVAASL